MGLCFSKKKAPSPPPPTTQNSNPNDKKIESISSSNQTSAAPAAEIKKSIVPAASATVIPLLAAPAEKEKKRADAPPTPAKKIGGAVAAAPAAAVAEDLKPGIVRTSSCTKEEVDAILIQCGRLSRSSSGKAGAEGGRRRYSGSKRSFDFDHEKKGDDFDDDSGDRPVSRPSPRRASGRERSGSRERDSGGRRVSRSPGRRSEGPGGSGGGERARQPAKMVSVPAREKTRGVSPGGANKRCASPRSRSPATGCRVLNENSAPSQTQSLSRSGSRKAEQSPYRRNPMAEIDENSKRGSGNGSKASRGGDGDDGLRKGNQSQAQRSGAAATPTTDVTNGVKANSVVVNCVRETVEKKESSLNASGEMPQSEQHGSRSVARTRSSRRSSRDFDNMIHPPSYTSLLLEDIQNYHQQNQNLGFTLPACVSKACSILEAVADLNSASSENKSSEADKSSGRRGLSSKEPFVESEIGVKEDLMEPSLHKYVTVRGAELEPQESAGSNSFVGQAWSCSWEPRSVDSTDRYWTSKSMNGDEVDQEAEVSPAAVHEYHDRESETRGRRPRGGVSNNNSMLSQATNSTSKKREMYNHSQLNRSGSGVSGLSGRVGGRVNSLPVIAAAASS